MTINQLCSSTEWVRVRVSTTPLTKCVQKCFTKDFRSSYITSFLTACPSSNVVTDWWRKRLPVRHINTQTEVTHLVILPPASVYEIKSEILKWWVLDITPIHCINVHSVKRWMRNYFFFDRKLFNLQNAKVIVMFRIYLVNTFKNVYFKGIVRLV